MKRASKQTRPKNAHASRLNTRKTTRTKRARKNASAQTPVHNSKRSRKTASATPTKNPAQGMRLTPITNGTALDHLSPGTAPRVIALLNLDDRTRFTLAVNADSKRHGKKDLVFLENKFLNPTELAKVAFLSPNATLNVIRNGQIELKTHIERPALAQGVFRCPNPNCITNAEKTPTRFGIAERPLRARCHYCEREFNRAELEHALI